MTAWKNYVLLIGFAGGLGALDALARAGAVPISEPVSNAMTIEDLGRILTELGLDPEPYESRNPDLRGFSVTFARDGWQIVVNIGLSRDRTVVWLFAPLSQISDVAQLPPAPLLALLARNGAMGMAHFSYDSEMGMLYLELPVPVGLVTPALLRSRIETLADLVRATVGLWDVRLWRKN